MNGKHIGIDLFNAQWVWLLLTLFAALVTSRESVGADFNGQLHGFVSQGYLKSNANHFYGDSETGSTDYRELGVNSSLIVHNRLRVAAQAISRRAGQTDDGGLGIDYLFGDLKFGSDSNTTWGLYVGRVKNPYGFYNDTRDVLFTHPGLLLPQSIYFDRVRDIALSSDGIQWYGEQRLESGYFEAQLGYVLPRIGTRTEIELFQRDTPGRLDARPSWGGRIMYTSTASSFRLAYSYIDLILDYESPNLPSDTINFSPHILSAEYNNANWSVVSEYALREFSFPAGAVPKQSFTGESYYVQLQYLLSTHWRTVAKADYMFVDKDDRSGHKFEQTVNGVKPAYSQFAKDYSLGLSWRHKNWLVVAEHHWIDGTAWLAVADNDASQTPTRYWRLFGVAVSARF